MRRGLILVLAMVAGVLVTATAASAVSCTLSSCSGVPELAATFGGTVSPRKLPRNDYVPITASVFGKVSTRDGAHPPAFREAAVDIDKDVRVHAKGLPACRISLRTREPDGGKSKIEKACHSALIGRGEAEAEIAFPKQKPLKVTSPLRIFNGGEKGREVTLLIVTFIAVPAPAAIVATVTIVRKGTGLHSIAKVPAVADGYGSLLSFSFKLGKTYSYKGKKVGYFEAKCPDSVFKVNVPTTVFKSEAHTPQQDSAFNLKGALAVPCTPVS